MKTKLVYVLTCAPEATYIEQALMAVWSARYHNPDAHIVLIVDDKTDALLAGKRGELLNYISEKIVVPFEDETLTPMYRSRWIKTQVRQLIQGDFLFVDCDTICCRSLAEVDDFECEIGAAADNNTIFSEDLYRENTIEQVAPLCDISKEEYYYSSGVLYCKDTENVHRLYKLWHQYWKDGVEKNIYMDQPALAKANMAMNHIISLLDDVYNSVLYTQNHLLSKAAILHITNFKYTSYLFKPKTLHIAREQGITEWMPELMLHIHDTYLPFDYAIKHSSIVQRIAWVSGIAFAARSYGEHIDNTYSEWVMRIGPEKLIKGMFRMHMYRLGVFTWLEYKRMQLITKNNLLSNKCAVR